MPNTLANAFGHTLMVTVSIQKVRLRQEGVVNREGALEAIRDATKTANNAPKEKSDGATWSVYQINHV